MFEATKAYINAIKETTKKINESGESKAFNIGKKAGKFLNKAYTSSPKDLVSTTKSVTSKTFSTVKNLANVAAHKSAADVVADVKTLPGKISEKISNLTTEKATGMTPKEIEQAKQVLKDLPKLTETLKNLKDLGIFQSEE